jgi:hypothetical protein
MLLVGVDAMLLVGGSGHSTGIAALAVGIFGSSIPQPATHAIAVKVSGILTILETLFADEHWPIMALRSRCLQSPVRPPPPQAPFPCE